MGYQLGQVSGEWHHSNQLEELIWKNLPEEREEKLDIDLRERWSRGNGHSSEKERV